MQVHAIYNKWILVNYSHDHLQCILTKYLRLEHVYICNRIHSCYNLIFLHNWVQWILQFFKTLTSTHKQLIIYWFRIFQTITLQSVHCIVPFRFLWLTINQNIIQRLWALKSWDTAQWIYQRAYNERTPWKANDSSKCSGWYFCASSWATPWSARTADALVFRALTPANRTSDASWWSSSTSLATSRAAGWCTPSFVRTSAAIGREVSRDTWRTKARGRTRTSD